MNDLDSLYMKKALLLAQLKKGTTGQKPTVGAILVDQQGIIVGQGVTQSTGEHAEQVLLSPLSVEITKGCTLYVTLEPCNIEVNTPACAKIIIEKQIKRVVVATLDRNPDVDGGGVFLLKQNGIKVEVGLLEEDAKNLNEDFFISKEKQRPFVFGKFALSLDGFLALNHDGNQGLSNSRSLRLSHLLRYRSDAILVGSQTILSDDPSLNVRLKFREKTILRVVLDPQGEVSLKSKVLSDPLPTLIVYRVGNVAQQKVDSVLSTPNKEVFFQKDGETLNELLTFLYQSKQIISLMIEGGGGTLSSFLMQGLLDKVFIVSTPYILGSGISPFSRLSINKISDAPILNNVKSKQIKDNVLIYGNILCPQTVITKK